MWSHTILEIYSHVVADDDGEMVEEWPDEGTPADWLELGLVGYCQGYVDDLVATIPLWKLLQWKLKGWWDDLRTRLDCRSAMFAANDWEDGDIELPDAIKDSIDDQAGRGEGLLCEELG